MSMRSKWMQRGSLVLLLALCLPYLARAAEEVEATGEAAIVDGDEPAAKEKARNAALRLAVEMVAGTIVSGISESKDFISIRDEVTSQSTGYVERFRVLEEKCQDGVCTSRIKAKVAKESLRNKLTKLGLLAQQMAYPRILLLVAEALPGGEAAGWWTGGQGRSQLFENEFIEYVNKVPNPDVVLELKSGKKSACVKREVATNAFDPRAKRCWDSVAAPLALRFVDYTTLRSHPAVKAALGEREVSDEIAAKIAGEAGAELAIAGKAVVSESAFGALGAKGQPGLVANASLRAIDPKTGVVIATANVQDRLPLLQGMPVQGAAANLLRRLARKSALEFREVLADALQKRMSAGKFLTLEISGIQSYRELQRIKRYLQSGIRGVTAVSERSLEGDKATLEVRSTASAQDIAMHLESKGLGKKSVRITKVNDGLVALKLQ